jgi:hypothetical protein
VYIPHGYANNKNIQLLFKYDIPDKVSKAYLKAKFRKMLFG